MHLQKKLGIGFIFFGLIIIVTMYFVADGGAFVFCALLGLMAIFFGAFQLMITADLTTTKTNSKSKIKKARH